MKSIKLAIDIGSSKTAIYQVGAGVILSEPSIVAISTADKRGINAVGVDAKRLLGKAGKSTSVFSPILEGEIDKDSAAQIMLQDFFKKIEISKFGSNVEALVTIPCGTENPAVMKFKDIFSACGINKVSFMEASIATAVGLDAPVSASTPCFIIDMGGGVTNIAAVSFDGVIAGITANIGGNNVDNMMIDYIEENYRLRIGAQTAEKIKCEIGSLLPGDTNSMVINGRDIDSGSPRSMHVKAEDVMEIIKLYVNKVYELASMVMAKLPPEVSAEIRSTGIYLAGGLSKIIGMEEYFVNEFAVNAKVNTDPELSTVIGAGRIMQNEKLYKRLRFN